jgi:hypothetical protein
MDMDHFILDVHFFVTRFNFFCPHINGTFFCPQIQFFLSPISLFVSCYALYVLPFDSARRAEYENANEKLRNPNNKKLWASKVAARVAHVLPIKRNLIAHVLLDSSGRFFMQPRFPSLRLPEPTEPKPKPTEPKPMPTEPKPTVCQPCDPSAYAFACYIIQNSAEQETKREIGDKKNWIWGQKKCSIYVGTKKIESGDKKNIMPFIFPSCWHFIHLQYRVFTRTHHPIPSHHRTTLFIHSVFLISHSQHQQSPAHQLFPFLFDIPLIILVLESNNSHSRILTSHSHRQIIH